MGKNVGNVGKMWEMWENNVGNVEKMWEMLDTYNLVRYVRSKIWKSGKMDFTTNLETGA